MASDSARLGFVRRALRTLRKGVKTTRHDLFKDMPDEPGNRAFTRKVMGRLVTSGAVRKIDAADVGQPSFYILADIDRLDEIAEDDESISDFLWGPDPTPPVLKVDLEQSVLDVKEAPPEPATEFLAPAQPTTDQPTPEPTGIAETNKLLGELIETMGAALQSTIYTRDAVDEIRKEFRVLAARQKELDEKLSKLMEVWK